MGVAGLALALATAAPADTESPVDLEPQHDRSPRGGTVAGESTFLDAPPFPGLDITDAFRVQVGSFAVPDAPLGSGHVTLHRPELRLRATWPATDALVLRASGNLATSHYDFRGRALSDPPAGIALGGDLDLHAARLSLEGAYRLDGFGPWLADEEVWSVLGAVYAGSRWEDGGFGDGLGAGGGLGVGYEIPDRLHLAVGVSLRTSIEDGGIDPGPLLSLRWDVSDRVTLRTREIGVQLDYDLAPVFDVYLTGFRSSDRFRLRGRTGAPGDLTFRDRQVRVGVGFDWVLANWLHWELELGSVVDRRIRIHDDDVGTLASGRGDPALYGEVRFEIRL